MNTDYLLVLPATWLLEDGTEIPEDHIAVECNTCHRKFSVPTDEANKATDACCVDCLIENEAPDDEDDNTTSDIFDDNDADSVISAALGL